MNFILTTIAGFMLMGVNAYAEEWRVADHPTFTPPTNLDVTFQVLPEVDPNRKLVLGWKGHELCYLIRVKNQPGHVTQQQYWELFMNTMKERCNDQVSILYEGEYKTLNGKDVTHKTIEYTCDGEKATQVYSLLIVSRAAYLVIGTSTDGDIPYMSDGISLLMKSAVEK